MEHHLTWYSYDRGFARTRSGMGIANWRRIWNTSIPRSSLMTGGGRAPGDLLTPHAQRDDIACVAEVVIGGEQGELVRDAERGDKRIHARELYAG
jgi:hypothetical protein